MLVADAVRSAGIGSGVGELRVAVLVRLVPSGVPAGTSARTTTVLADPATSRVPKSQLTWLRAGLVAQVPALVLSPSGSTVSPSGSASVRVTELAADGPTLPSSRV